MKTSKKIFLLLSLFLALGACEEMFDLDLRENPNSPTPDKADIEAVYNSIQLNFRSFFTGAGFTMNITRQRAMTSNNHERYAAPEFRDGYWRTAYANLLPDIYLLEERADLPGNENLSFHKATVLIMRAYTMTTLVDIFGDVPFVKPITGTSDDINPAPRDGEELYAEALGLLNQAIDILDDDELHPGRPATDLYYDTDEEKWSTLAKTLKFRIYLNTRLVDNQVATKIADEDLLANIISAAADDFQFTYGTNRSEPNVRHPFYNNSYETEDGTFMSNYFMWQLRGAKTIVDPRIRYYFYRQKPLTTGHPIEVWGCVLSQTPFDVLPEDLVHYTDIDPDMPYCVASVDGYWGRDHGNGTGLPPDGPLRTVYGLYPGGGRWDNNSHVKTTESGTLGALGEGIQPIMLSSFVYFMRAEAALAGITAEDARLMLQTAIQRSMAKVRSFESKIPASDLNRVIGNDPVTGDPILASTLLATPALITDYIDYVLAEYDAADVGERMNIIAKEYNIALFGNGIEMYNMYRRTGYPDNFQPIVDPLQNDDFPLSFYYPLSAVQRNQNISQKPDLNQRVFWDNNTFTLH